MLRIRSVLLVAAGAVAVAAGWAAPAFAHTGFEPSEAAPGSVVDLTLNVEYERDGVGFSRVELYFPETEAIEVVAAPPVPGWTAGTSQTPEGIRVVTWTGGPATDDFAFPITIGPLPSEPGRLQFKVLQTYDDGEVSRWIAEWPAGAEEPDDPGPVLDLVPGAAGVVPSTTAVAPTATAAPTTTSATDPTTAPSANRLDDVAVGTTDDDGGSNVGALVAGLAAGIVVGGLIVYRFVWRPRRASRS